MIKGLKPRSTAKRAGKGWYGEKMSEGETYLSADEERDARKRTGIHYSH